MPKATGSFEVASWDEETYEEVGDGKLTRASVTQTFTGDVDGEGAVQWLMSYREDGTAHFVGLQRIRGTIGGRTIGDFDGKVASGTWSVVPGGGSADLQQLRGTGSFEAPMGPKASFELDYELE